MHAAEKDGDQPWRSTRELVTLCLGTVNSDETIPAFDPGAAVVVPIPELQHTAKMDRAMQIWAQADCGIIKVGEGLDHLQVGQ